MTGARSLHPRLLVLVAGTGTEVGKTWVAAAMLRRLRDEGLFVSARKPAQSFAEGDGATDAEVLGAASGEDATVVCPAHRWYPRPMAPFMAAAALGMPPFAITHLAQEVRWPAGIDIGLVETAGGVRSPIASDGGDTVALATIVRPDIVLLVADAGLGTINAVRLSLDALEGVGAETAVVLNRYAAGDDLHRRNAEWLATNLGARLFTDVDSVVTLVRERLATQ